jgi:hypothetical protein
VTVAVGLNSMLTAQLVPTPSMSRMEQGPFGATQGGVTGPD